jgi:hypothetical protein
MTIHPVDCYVVGMRTKPIDYQIRVQGHLDSALSEWFAPLTVINEPNGEAILSGPLRDQAELYGLLLRLYNLNFTLLAVQRLPIDPPDLQVDE